ncbi:hypothetical protein Tco_0037111 [Tanacetum coccineum]
MPSMSNTFNNCVIYDLIDDELPEYTQMDEEFVNLFDDGTNEDVQLGEELLDESADDLPHLDDFEEDATHDYDHTDSFIDDGPFGDEDTKTDSDNDY